ncbi:glutamate:gamma-aminobutyrate antiporter [Eubacterium sp. 1001713B170207_170306_E7]|uniref:glutamate:gamma-aminobutyrate antiporter n=1 Tax=Eubacterium sp. 1001713B170207_170306_E7 TaxID=2787097 RepID=UPI00189C2B53|nr:glutamate:gamma-aminobutyrate antiporter [Eubacterium sp. 1001713B170207_170306_E7]
MKNQLLNDTTKTSKLTLFSFFAMTASMVMTADKYATFASSGFSLAFFLVAGGFLWFIPVSLCAAEMATVEGWEEGGVFTWVGKTIGERFGFAAIFFQWFQITIGFISMIYFILGSFSYVFNIPALEQNPFIKFIGVLVVFWALSLSQLGGTKYTAMISKIGFIAGILFPVLLLFGLTGAYVSSGGPIHLEMNLHTLIPDFKDVDDLVIFASFILSFMGIEVSATHVNQLKNPSRNYPLTMIILVVLAIILNTVGGISVAMVVPAQDLSYSSGVVQTFENLFRYFNPNLLWMVRILGAMIAVGVMAEVSSWVVGPSRGLYVAAKDNLLPKVFKKTNRRGIPTNLILGQGVIVTIWAAVLTFGGGGNNLSFLTAISLSVVIYLITYFLFFGAYFILLYKHPEYKRAYQIPGGRLVKTIVAGIGLLMSIFTFVVTFFPPDQLAPGNDMRYDMILVISFLIVLTLPFLLYHIERKKHKN